MAETINRLRGENLSREEICKGYDDWGLNYDADTTDKLGYVGYENCCDVINKHFSQYRDSIEILDVGAGTGLLGARLCRTGFRVIDGVDPSNGMLKIAEKKKIYRNLYCKYFTAQPVDVFRNSMYDVVTSSGCLSPGHLPYDSILEMVRITKPGGIICLTGRLNSVVESPEYAGLLPLCKSLEEAGKWEKIEIREYNGYHINEDVKGILLVYRVL